MPEFDRIFKIIDQWTIAPTQSLIYELRRHLHKGR